jgi:hypothetical protein
VGEWTETGSFTERNGKTVAVEHKPGDVRLVIRAPVRNGPVLTRIVLGGEHRAAFLTLFARAGQAAEQGAESGAGGGTRCRSCQALIRDDGDDERGECTGACGTPSGRTGD